MRQDYIAARVGETVDEVTRDMVIHNVENIVVVEGDGLLKPIGVARAADILRLRRWVIEEEGLGNQPVRAKASLPRIADANASIVRRRVAARPPALAFTTGRSEGAGVPGKRPPPSRLRKSSTATRILHHGVDVFPGHAGNDEGAFVYSPFESDCGHSNPWLRDSRRRCR